MAEKKWWMKYSLLSEQSANNIRAMFDAKRCCDEQGISYESKYDVIKGTPERDAFMRAHGARNIDDLIEEQMEKRRQYCGESDD